MCEFCGKRYYRKNIMNKHRINCQSRLKKVAANSIQDQPGSNLTQEELSLSPLDEHMGIPQNLIHQLVIHNDQLKPLLVIPETFFN